MHPDRLLIGPHADSAAKCTIVSIASSRSSVSTRSVSQIEPRTNRSSARSFHQIPDWLDFLHRKARRARPGARPGCFLQPIMDKVGSDKPRATMMDEPRQRWSPPSAMRKLWRQWRGVIPRALVVERLSSTQYAGLRAGVGLSSVEIGSTRTSCPSRPSATPSSAIASAKSYHEATPESVQWKVPAASPFTPRARMRLSHRSCPCRSPDMDRQPTNHSTSSQKSQNRQHEVSAIGQSQAHAVRKIITSDEARPARPVHRSI